MFYATDFGMFMRFFFFFGGFLRTDSTHISLGTQNIFWCLLKAILSSCVVYSTAYHLVFTASILYISYCIWHVKIKHLPIKET